MIHPPFGMSLLLDFLLALFLLILQLMHGAVAINLAFYTAYLIFDKENSINPFGGNHNVENKNYLRT